MYDWHAATYVEQPPLADLRCAFLAVRAKWILSCDKCQASPTTLGAIAARIAELTPQTSGMFRNYDGQPIPW